MAAGGRAVLGWAAAFAGVWAGAACSAPQGGAGLEGVYFGLRADQISERVRTDYYTFLADGRAFRGFPSEGLGRAVDWDYECRNAECGTYERRGDEIRFRNDASGSDTTFRLDAAGVLRKQERPISYRRMHLLDAERLDGTWGVFDREKGEAVVALQLGPDGRFREAGLLRYLSWEKLGPDPSAREAQVVEKGRGAYAIRKGTLELRYDAGPTVYLMVATPPGIDPRGAPPTLQLNAQTFEQAQ